MFRALLEEGKEPPEFDEIGQTVRVTFLGQAADQAFRALINFLVQHQGAQLDVDTLLLLHFFRRRHEAQLLEIREAYPYDDRLLRERLATMENQLLVIEHTGSGSGKRYRLSRRAAAILNETTTYDLTRRLDKEAIKVRILTLLKDRPLRNQEVRAFTDLDRQQVTAIMQELEDEGLARLQGFGAGAQWYAVDKEELKET